MTMAVEEQRFRIRRSIEEKLGVEEAAYLIEGRPAGGWDALVTKDYLDLRLAAQSSELRVEFRDQTTRLIRWFIPTVFAGMTVSSGFVAVLVAWLT
jgi:hypothetical protein